MRTNLDVSAFSPVEPAEMRQVEGGLVVIAIIAVYSFPQCNKFGKPPPG